MEIQSEVRGGDPRVEPGGRSGENASGYRRAVACVQSAGYMSVVFSVPQRAVTSSAFGLPHGCKCIAYISFVTHSVKECSRGTASLRCINKV